ncbi:MAG: hypothetical protein GX596_00825 [Propionibacterium sp.]|nr:hypothetical protein [Propionibacterium sp.]
MVVAGIASILSLDLFGLGVGVMLLVYGAIMCAIVYAAYRRHSWAWGLLVAVALLNGFSVGSFLETDQWSQRITIGIALIFIVAAGIASILPSTRLAMQRGQS